MKKSIFITGAASGIGRAAALRFAAEGWYVGLFDKNEAGVAELAKQIGTENCCYGALDVTDPDAYKVAADHFGSHTGGTLNALFNCAGIMFMGPFESLSLKQHKLTYDINIFGVVNGIFHCLDMLKRTKGSHIITMCSASAFYGVPDLSTYSSSKFAVKGLTESLSIEFEKWNITVTDLMPLYVNTPMIQQQQVVNGSLRTFGAGLTPDGIAEIVWQAAHSRKVHWVPTFKLKFLSTVARYFPFMERTVMKMISS
jgi:NAD(P)-dependent dehydrogenase (short-subunit alcohol dehydrogenase family)